jgi:hypothetical protein
LWTTRAFAAACSRSRFCRILGSKRLPFPTVGIVQLDRLFEGEHVPDDPTVYLDQRYIDYLAKNGEDMKQMHWRNFERLTTEFFRRLGYEVDLGPGTKDGGIDVRVWTDKEAKVGPPIMLIQCKRTKDNIGIETVKAFWADVQFHKAESGLIATTAAVTRDSKALCEARQYPLSFAEGEHVKQWSRSMWRLRPKRRRAKIPNRHREPGRTRAVRSRRQRRMVQRMAAGRDAGLLRAVRPQPGRRVHLLRHADSSLAVRHLHDGNDALGRDIERRIRGILPQRL